MVYGIVDDDPLDLEVGHLRVVKRIAHHEPLGRKTNLCNSGYPGSDLRQIQDTSSKIDTQHGLAVSLL